MSNFVERKQCPACTSASFNTIYSLPVDSKIIVDYLNAFYNAQGGVETDYLKDWVYELSTCHECSLTFQRIILNDSFMERLYERWINPSVTFEESKKHPLHYYLNLVEEIRQLIVFFKKKPHELNMLDFGLGWAEWCKVAAALGCNVAGAELSKSRKANALKYNIKIIDLKSDFNERFDFINTEQVFEHISNPLKTLQKLSLALSLGGIVKISVPDGYRLGDVLKYNDWQAPKGTVNSMNMIAPLEHVNCFNSTSLKKMAQLAGLTFVPELAYRNYPTSIFDFIKNKYRALYIDKLRANKGTYLFFQKSKNI